MKECERNGWKGNKAAMRRSQAMEVMVPNVLAFIDDKLYALPTENPRQQTKNATVTVNPLDLLSS
jgi:hypothetical protein